MSAALVTGGASGIGAALVARLRAEGFDVRVLDLTTGFDVGDPRDWETVDAVDVACLNAGVLGGPADPAELTLDGYRRAMAVNVDGVVLGVRRVARVIDAASGTFGVRLELPNPGNAIPAGAKCKVRFAK